MNRHEREAFERAVIAYLDGALDAAEAEALRQQADASPACRAVLARAEEFWQALSGLAQVESNRLPRVDLKDAVLAAISADRLPHDDPALESPARETIAAAARELFIDPADDDARAVADELRAVSSTHREEVEAYAELAAELTALEQDASPVCPPIDLRESILATVEGRERSRGRESRKADPNIVSFQRGRLHRSQPVQWPVIAAAAVLLMLVGGWTLLMPGEEGTPSEPVAVTPERVPDTPEPPTVTAEPVPAPEQTPLENAFDRMAEAMPEPLHTAPKPEGTAAPDLGAITLDDLWGAQQAALTDPDARSAVRAFATVPAEHARTLIEEPGQRPDVLVGLAASLPPTKARSALMALREDRTPTASQVFAQGEATWFSRIEAPEEAPPLGAPDLAQIIADLRAIDPENALSYYWEAVDRLREGDLEGALALLQAAEELESAQAYSLETARATRTALEEAGMTPDAAAAAAALSAGMNQYDFITSLGQELVDEAFRYDAMGHSEAAEQILSAAQRFGAQIEAGSNVSWEQLAGLDLQRAAIEALEAFLIDPEELMALTNDALNLVVGMESMASFFEAMNNLFRQPFDADFFTEFSNMILMQGDLDLFAMGQAPAAPGQPR